MKNAFVLVHHHGDNGTVDEGMILKDIAWNRFSELETAGLVREATSEDMAAGYAPPFTPHSEDTGSAAAGTTEQLTGGAKEKQEPLNKKAAAPANKAG